MAFKALIFSIKPRLHFQPIFILKTTLGTDSCDESFLNSAQSKSSKQRNGVTCTPQYLYHYTNLEGMKAIISSGYINQRDAAFGAGVYFTQLGPDNSTRDLIKNNWEDGTAIITNGNINATTEFYIRIPTKYIPGVASVGDGKDIWLYPKDLYLNNTDAEVYQRSYNINQIVRR